MEYNKSNFIYLKKTSMEKYFNELEKAENICEYFPIVTKIIVRKVIEGLLRDIAKKYNIENGVAVWNLLNNIKLSTQFSFSEEAYNYIETILTNGYEHMSLNNKNKGVSKHPIEILELAHNIFYWYLKKTETSKFRLINKLSFKAPSTIEYMEKVIRKIKEDIILRDSAINNLRQKIIELSSEPKSILELNNIIIEIKIEKNDLEERLTILAEKVEIQKKQIFDIEKNYKLYMKKLDNLREKCSENQELLFEKESQLVKAEIQRQELKDSIRNLDEQDDSIETREFYLEEELRIVRQAYEKLLKLTNQYQDILETIEFSYDEELQKILESQKSNLNMEINFEDGIFNENIINYNKNITEAKRKISIFKGILNENIKSKIKSEPVYRGYLRLKGKELRILYTIIKSINTTPNLINKSKGLISTKTNNYDKFLTLLNKNLEDLKNISDDEIKLIIYYKLIKLSKVPLGNVCNRKQFMKALEDMVDKAFEILLTKKDFKARIKKEDAITAYYLEKVIASLKSKNINLHIPDGLVDRIYNIIIGLKQSEENIGKEKKYYNKFDLDNMPEAVFKMSIKSHPFMFLSIMIDLGDINSCKEIASIIFEIDNIVEKRQLSQVYDNSIGIRVSNEYFMILLFLSSGITPLSLSEQEDLLPLLVMEIMSIDLIAVDDVINLESYTKIVRLWKYKQQKYNGIFIEKEDAENTLDLLVREKEGLEASFEELIKTNNVLVQKYNNYKGEFKSIIMNSDKKVLLPSYMNYEELRNKKKLTENSIIESKSKFGPLKSMLSPEVWKEQASKIINESNIQETEKHLIEEAKHKPYFQKEYSVFSELEEKIKSTNELANKNIENIKNKDALIENIKNRISELQKQLNTIKELYPDVEEGYY